MWRKRVILSTKDDGTRVYAALIDYIIIELRDFTSVVSIFVHVSATHSYG